MGNDLDLAVALLGDDNVVAEVVGAALDLDAVLEELLESGDVEDLVVGGLRSVDDVLQEGRLANRCDTPLTIALTYLLSLLLGLASLLLLRNMTLAYCIVFH